MSNAQVLTVDQVAEQLHLAPRTVLEWLRTGRLQGVKLGRLWRVRPEAVAALIEHSERHSSQGQG